MPLQWQSLEEGAGRRCSECVFMVVLLLFQIQILYSPSFALIHLFFSFDVLLVHANCINSLSRHAAVCLIYNIILFDCSSPITLAYSRHLQLTSNTSISSIFLSRHAAVSLLPLVYSLQVLLFQTYMSLVCSLHLY